MISPSTAGLALSVAKGLVKFGGRLDRLLAEKVAVRSGLELKLPAIDYSPGPNVVVPQLQAYLASTSEAEPGPLGAQRADLAALLTPDYTYQPGDLGKLRQFFALAFPEEAVGPAVSPDDTFLNYLRDAMPNARPSLPDSATDTDKTKRANYQAAMLASAFYVDPGADLRQLGYPVRIGLLVVDVLAEFGAENTQLFVRDERLRTGVQAVLERFADANLETYDAWSPLLRHALSSTLNGMLDARESWQGDNPWLGATLGALADARAAAGDDGDDYVMGLLQGRGYRPFVANVLSRSATLLDGADAPAFQQIVADVLKQAQPLVQNGSGSFAEFFSDHWTDLVHAALVSASQHGSSLLEGESPVMRDVLNAVLKTLAGTSASNLLTSDTLFAVTNAALGAVATHPELWSNGGEQWVGQVISSAIKAVSDQGVQATFTANGLKTILRNATGVLAQHPEWLAKNPGLLQDVVGATLRQLASADTVTATSIATAAIQSALESIAARPNLVSTKYSAVVADLAGQLAADVKAQSLSALQASAIVTAAAKAVLLHPELFVDPKGIAGIVINAALAAAKGDPAQLLSGQTLVAVVQQLLQVAARYGALLVANAGADLQQKLTSVLSAALAAASQELGRAMDLAALPAVLADAVAAWARGEVATVAAGDPSFQKLIDQIVLRVTSATASPA